MKENIEKLAVLLTDYCLEVKEGELVLIGSRGGFSAQILMENIYKNCLLKGAYPYLHFSSDDARKMLYKFGNNDQLSKADPIYKYICETVNKELIILSEDNTRIFSNSDPEKQAVHAKTRRVFYDIAEKREKEGTYRWSLTLSPTPAYAKDANFTFPEFEEFMYNACKLNLDNPVDGWKELSKEQEKFVNYLDNVNKIQIKAQGTDLTLSVKGRKWQNCDGKLNMPDGEIFTGPIEDSANGFITFSYPAVFRGNEVDGVFLEFKDGAVTKAKAQKGFTFLEKMIALDEGSKRIGEVAIGTNNDIKHFTRNILFDEKIGGTCHIALGKGYPNTGSQLRSALHWDMICNLKEGGEIYCDEKLIYRDGKFLI